MTRLWIRVYGLPLGFLDPEWAVKTLDLVGLVETLEYDGDGLPDEPEFRGQVLVDLSKPLIPGCYVPDSDSSGAGDNGLPNGHVHEAAPFRDNNDNIEPEFIPINGVYQNGYLSHPNPMVSSSTSDSWAYDSASEQGIQSSVSSETDPTTPESYHNPNSTRFFEENRAAIPQGDPYAPITQARTQVNYAGGFRISATLEESFLTDSSESEEFVLPAIACSAATDVAPALLENLSLHDQSDAQPHANMHPNDPLFGYDGSTWSQKRCKIKALNLLSKGGFTLPANTSSHAVAKCFSDVSNAAHLGFLSSSSHPFGGTSTGSTSTWFMGFSGCKWKGEEASTTSGKILKLSADGVASKLFAM
uniref:DUF4283 domain-containing protein n=1 Tax=Chenopodium quinoa TaxID=63459 RepID=A0A803MA65_CHEQI